MGEWTVKSQMIRTRETEKRATYWKKGREVRSDQNASLLCSSIRASKSRKVIELTASGNRIINMEAFLFRYAFMLSWFSQAPLPLPLPPPRPSASIFAPHALPPPGSITLFPPLPNQAPEGVAGPVESRISFNERPFRPLPPAFVLDGGERESTSDSAESSSRSSSGSPSESVVDSDSALGWGVEDWVRGVREEVVWEEGAREDGESGGFGFGFGLGVLAVGDGKYPPGVWLRFGEVGVEGAVVKTTGTERW